MRRTRALWMLAVMIPALSFAAHTVAVLDGTSWKIEAEPDDMAQKKGAAQFKDVLVFAQGMASLQERGKSGLQAAPYEVLSTGKEGKEHTFRMELASRGEGKWTWTGTVQGASMDGKLIQTKPDGSVLTYTFKGSKLD